ncbi:MAG: hypothetical protein QY316_13065 [Thermodesulfobacteriota bacterium]|nr:MAG: hypothetical protein QY316_13065 [Thermodesulfobacteriota bacterium]
MAKSLTMERSRRKELEDIKKLKPSEKLDMATELSDFCLELMKAGKEAIDSVSGKKS